VEDFHRHLGILALVSPFAQISILSIADRYCRVVLAILEFQDAASDHILMQILGYVCMACAIMTLTFSSLPVIAFRAHRVDLEAQDRAMNISLLFSESTRLVWWNIHVLLALPAVLMA
jgi:hypothetical protein